MISPSKTLFFLLTLHSSHSAFSITIPIYFLGLSLSKLH